VTTPRTLSAPALVALATLALSSATHAAAVDDVATANAAGKAVFLVVTDGPGPGLDAARAAAAAAQALAPATTIVELDRRDPAQAPAVAAYRVAAAPVPLVLVIASNGVATGAAKPGEGAAQRLAALIPSPKKADYLKHLSQQKVALVAFSRANMPERSGLFESLSSATRTLGDKAALVLVDLDDKAEARFVTDLKVDPAATQPQLVVVNPKGSVLGRLAGAPKAEEIVAAATKTHCCSDPNCKDCKDGGK
jgi:hypothetical protein